jgi:hypothetical protein
MFLNALTMDAQHERAYIMATTRKRTGKTIDVSDVFPAEQQHAQPPLQQLPNYGYPAAPPDFDDYDDITALNSVLAGLGALESDTKGFINVYRMAQVNGQKSEKYLDRFEVADFADGNLLDHLKNTYGGGKFHVYVYRPSGGGLAANKIIDIETAPGSLAAVSPAAAPQAPVDLMPIIAAMQQGFEKMFSALQQAQPKPQSNLERLEELKLLRDVFTPAQSAQPAQYNPVEMMKLGVELAQAGGGGGDSNNAWVGKIIDTFGKPLVETVMASQAAKAAKPAIAPRAAIASPNSSPVDGGGAGGNQLKFDTNESEDTGVNIMIKGYVKMLTGAASSNHDVTDYADGILNFIPSSQLPEFEAMLRAPDWQEKFAQYTSAVLQYPQWFTSLRDTIIQYIDEDRATASGAVSDNSLLTGANSGDSVVPHENADTGKIPDTDNPGTTA